MSYLYCQNAECGGYLGSLGDTSCRHCGWAFPEELTMSYSPANESMKLTDEEIINALGVADVTGVATRDLFLSDARIIENVVWKKLGKK